MHTSDGWVEYDAHMKIQLDSCRELLGFHASAIIKHFALDALQLKEDDESIRDFVEEIIARGLNSLDEERNYNG